MSKSDYIDAAVYAEEYNISYSQVIEDIKAGKVEGKKENGAWWVVNDEASMPPSSGYVSQSNFKSLRNSPSPASNYTHHAPSETSAITLKFVATASLWLTIIGVIIRMITLGFPSSVFEWAILVGYLFAGIVTWAIFRGFSDVIRLLSIIAANSRK